MGCGTGQLTNFLSIAHRSVLGVDVCMNSLGLAQKFKVENGLDRASFAQMNLFRPALKDGFFDVVISQRRVAPHGRLPGGLPSHLPAGQAGRVCRGWALQLI